MALKRIYERIPLDSLGYAGGWAEVCVNPSKQQAEAYFEANDDLLLAARSLSITPDMTLEEVQALRAQDRERQAAVEERFIRARCAVYGKVQIDGQVWDLSTAEGYRAFEDEGDVNVTLLMDGEWQRRRRERLSRVADSFRSQNGAKPDAGAERPAVGAAA